MFFLQGLSLLRFCAGIYSYNEYAYSCLDDTQNSLDGPTHYAQKHYPNLPHKNADFLNAKDVSGGLPDSQSKTVLVSHQELGSICIKLLANSLL